MVFIQNPLVQMPTVSIWLQAEILFPFPVAPMEEPSQEIPICGQPAESAEFTKLPGRSFESSLGNRDGTSQLEASSEGMYMLLAF